MPLPDVRLPKPAARDTNANDTDQDNEPEQSRQQLAYRWRHRGMSRANTAIDRRVHCRPTCSWYFILSCSNNRMNYYTNDRENFFQKNNVESGTFIPKHYFVAQKDQECSRSILSCWLTIVTSNILNSSVTNIRNHLHRKHYLGHYWIILEVVRRCCHCHRDVLWEQEFYPLHESKDCPDTQMCKVLVTLYSSFQIGHFSKAQQALQIWIEELIKPDY